MHWNDSLPIHHRAGSIIFMLSVFSSLSGCTTTLQRQRYQLAEDQRQMVRRFEGYETTSRDWSSWHCLKKVLELPTDAGGFLAYPILLGLSPLCMFSTDAAPTKFDSRLGGLLVVKVMDDAGNPLKDVEWIVGDQRQRTSNSGEIRLLIPKDGLSMTQPDPRFVVGFAVPSKLSMPSSTSTPSTIRYRWDNVDDQTRRVVAEVDGTRLEDVSRIVLVDTEAPTDDVPTVQDAELVIAQKVVHAMLQHGRKRVAVFAQTTVAEGPKWLAEVSTSLQSRLESSAEARQNQFTVVSAALIKRAVKGIAAEEKVISEIGRLTGADAFLMISGKDVADGHLIDARLLRMDGISMQASTKLLVRQAR